MKLCSACLLGIKCRYDATSKENDKVIELAKRETLIPVCPEQLGGLPTPREPTEIAGDRVLTKDGEDKTENFIRGAEETLRIAKLFGIKEAVLKQGSPSCGCGEVYDGSFSGNKTSGDGITTRVLKKEGINVVSENEL